MSSLGGRTPSGQASEESLKYVDAGKQLIQLAHSTGLQYQEQTPMLKHASGATLWCGGERCAMNAGWLKQNNVSHIVFCQTPEGEMHHRADGYFTYLDFPIGWMVHQRQHMESPEAVTRMMTPMFQFVDEALNSGRSVLIHCLAGAHRAGSSTIAALMFFCNLSFPEAVRAAKSLRNQIEPIGNFAPMLEMLETARKSNMLPRCIEADGSVRFRQLDVASPGPPVQA